MKGMKKGQGIAVLVVFVLILGLLGYYAGTIISATGKGADDSLKLGLDLAGGVSITYEAVGETPTSEQMADTILKLQQRIENDLGNEASTTEASVYQVGDRRITVEIPGVSDANALLEALGTPGTLYFITQTDADGNTNYSYNQATGEYALNYEIEDLIDNGSVVLTGSDVASSDAKYRTNQTTNASEPVVALSFTSKGAKAFADATAKAAAAGQTIGIYYDGHFVSVPRVNEAINGGEAVIEGMESFEAAEKLASYIRIGGLDIKLQEIQSEVVGAQLGSDALASSFKAAAIGLALVMVFLIAVYLFPGFVASLALALYTVLTISILYLFDVTLTLPGIAGIILSIGMAVDANVIIFTRIREEVAAGKNVKASVEAGFHKAMSAIIDGNITTLIAAAVLGVLGSGTVKGFAITLALGVILSMFTALLITRLLVQAFIAVGVTNTKVYGKAKAFKTIDFIGKKAIFFALSIVVIGAGVISMVAHSAMGAKSLNYSLEFLGGTSTTVTFDQEYSLEEIDSKIVPVVSTITGDNDIQVQKVDGGNTVIFKTKTLQLAEREAFNKAMEENFGVTEEKISSENISSTVSGEMRRQSVIAVLVAVLLMLVYIWIRFKDLRFASSAVIALFHDVLVVLALYALARITVGSAFIACMLTVIGYSINDTIVIFDRIRERMNGRSEFRREELETLCNTSLTDTLTRSLSTSFTTAITVLMLLILGVSSIREFALPLLAGVIVGTYSSICLATELWFLMKIYIKRHTKDGDYSSKPKKAKKVHEKATRENQGILV